jgi:hypothetical protein
MIKMNEKKKWKKCPKCDGFIPEEWTTHKCGWFKEEIVENDKPSVQDRIEIGQAFNQASNLLKEFDEEKYKELVRKFYKANKELRKEFGG